jgi:hypothetical protein
MYMRKAVFQVAPVAIPAVVLLWLNAYICRDWFTHPTAWMNSLHGFQAALAKYGVSWSPAWWPFWDCGMPVEFTSAPLVPAMAAAIASLRHVSPLLGYQSVSAIFYCAAPVALFLLAWWITRAPGYSFLAGLFYSLLSPAQILVPDGQFVWAGLLTPHRFKLQAVWDETPHCAALTFLFLFILFLITANETRRPAPTALAAISLTLAILAWPFAIVGAVLSVACLATVRPLAGWRTVAVLFAALLLAARFLPPSLWYAIGAASAAHDGWNTGVLKFYAAIAVIWFTMDHFIQRAKDWRLPWMVFWAVAMSAAPLVLMWFQRQLFPQASRFRMELEASIALLAVFGLRPLIQRLPRTAIAVLALASLAFALHLTLDYRRVAKNVLYPAEAARTLEYRITRRVADELPGARVMLPGSVSHWANAFINIPQLGGGEGITAYSQTLHSAQKSVFESDPRASTWLTAYGVSAVVVPARDSAEFWKPFAHPEQYADLLPELWREEGVAVYRVPQRSGSLAHVVPEAALGSADRYAEALHSAAATEASFHWLNRNHAVAQVSTLPGQAVSLQVSYHPGWRATIDGRTAEVHRDSLGLMWLRPGRTGPISIELVYDGGAELRICAWVTLVSIVAAVWYLVRGGFR